MLKYLEGSNAGGRGIGQRHGAIRVQDDIHSRRTIKIAGKVTGTGLSQHRFIGRITAAQVHYGSIRGKRAQLPSLSGTSLYGMFEMPERIGIMAPKRRITSG